MFSNVFYACLYTRVDLSKFRKWKSGFLLSEEEITNKGESLEWSLLFWIKIGDISMKVAQ